MKPDLIKIQQVCNFEQTIDGRSGSLDHVEQLLSPDSHHETKEAFGAGDAEAHP
jgi:hypothetical protein